MSVDPKLLDKAIDAQATARRWEHRVQIAEARVVDCEQDVEAAEDALIVAKHGLTLAKAGLWTRRKRYKAWQATADRARMRLRRRSFPGRQGQRSLAKL